MNKNSIANGRPVEEAREDAGRILAEEELARMETMGVPKEHRHRPHVVIGVPNSAKPGAKGYAEGMGAYYYEDALFKVTNKRSYIEKDVEARKKVVTENIQFNEEFLYYVEGKDVDVVDDSIVAGTTITEIIKRIRAAGARSVNVRITAPQIVDECNSGANIRYSDPGLLALGKTVREISEHIGADSLSYLSTEGLAKSIRKPLGNLCMSCITSEYHLKMPEKRRPSKKPQALVSRAA